MKTSIGEIPFTMAYESEVVISVEVGIPSYRVQHYDEESNNKENLDLLEERR